MLYETTWRIKKVKTTEKIKFPKAKTCMIPSQWQNHRDGEEISGCQGLGRVGV